MKKYTAKEVGDPKNKALFDELARLLAHAMTEDAGHRWLFSNHSRKAYLAALPGYMRILIKLAIECDATFRVITKDEVPLPPHSKVEDDSTTQPQIQLSPDATIRAVAITIPPHGNANFDSPISAARAGILQLPYICGLRMVWRLQFEFLPLLDQMHNDMFPDPLTKYHNWHLFYLVAHPDTRGQGLGKKLLLDVQQEVKQFNELESQKAEAAGKEFIPAPLYLEASSFVNRRLYSRVGFEEKTNSVFGKLAESEDQHITEDGKVIGGRQFGMVWMP